jgi:NDP-sugar pyrophosphorylase family protein
MMGGYKVKRAVILAGGRGVRLRPYTVALPKPLMPIGEYPILEVIIRQLVTNGFKHITLAVNHQSDIIKAFFQDGSKWGIKIDYSLETKPLSTMGPLKLIKDLPKNFLVMNGDVVSDVNYAEFLDEHIKSECIFSISAHNRQEKVDYGVLNTKTDGDTHTLSGFEEKPINSYLVSMGIYAVRSKVLDYIPEDVPFGFDTLMRFFLASDIKVNVKPHDGYWLDIGRPDDYIRATEEFDSIKHILKIGETV